MSDSNTIYIHCNASPVQGQKKKKFYKYGNFKERRQAHREGNKHSFNHRNRNRRPRHQRHNGAPAEQQSPAAPSQQTSNPAPGAREATPSQRPSASTHTSPSSAGANSSSSSQHEAPASSSQSQASGHSSTRPLKYLAMDCEMVGTGPKGHISHLARCSVVSYEGDVIYDKFIKPPVPVTDYRTRWSGVRPRDLARAMPYSQARKEILRLLMGKVVVGHAIHNDFKVLGYGHPAALTRDTSRIPLLNLKAGFGANECASLKRLTKAIFNRDIQTGKKGHSSVEDAKATMELYKVVEVEWERKLASGACEATSSQGH